MVGPCPFCRSEVGPMAVTNFGSWYVYCTCGARGPRAETEVGALTLWNVRCRKNEEETEDES